MNLSKNNLMYLFCVSSVHILLPQVLRTSEAKLKIATFPTSSSFPFSMFSSISDSLSSFSVGYLTWYGNVISSPVAKKLVIFRALTSSQMNSTEEADPTCGTRSQKKCLKIGKFTIRTLRSKDVRVKIVRTVLFLANNSSRS